MQENINQIAISEHGIIQINDGSLLELISGASGASTPTGNGSIPNPTLPGPGSGHTNFNCYPNPVSGTTA